MEVECFSYEGQIITANQLSHTHTCMQMVTHSHTGASPDVVLALMLLLSADRCIPACVQTSSCCTDRLVKCILHYFDCAAAFFLSSLISIRATVGKRTSCNMQPAKENNICIVLLFAAAQLIQQVDH